MRVLALHAYYRSAGGEDASFDAETELLSARGHEVVRFTANNKDLSSIPIVRRAIAPVWNSAIANDLRQVILTTRPQVAYCNNTFPSLSANVIHLMASMGLPVMLAIRNYRLACVNGLLFRDDHPCVLCLPLALPVHGIVHSCYADSKLGSVVAAGAVTTMRRTVKRNRRIVTYAAVSQHVARFVQSVAIPADRILVKPNTVYPQPKGRLAAGRDVVFIGRLEPEKGLALAIQAFARMAKASDVLHVVGEGREAKLAIGYSGPGQVLYSTHLSHTEIYRLLSVAAVCVVPSVWDEPFGRVAIESMACGTPVIVSNRGGLAEIPIHGDSGWVVDPHQVDDFASLIRVTMSSSSQSRMRAAALDRFARMYSPAVVVEILEESLRRTILNATGSTRSSTKGHKWNRKRARDVELD